MFCWIFPSNSPSAQYTEKTQDIFQFWSLHHKKDMELLGVGPEEGHKDNQMAGARPLQGHAENARAFQPGEEEAPGGH